MLESVHIGQLAFCSLLFFEEICDLTTHSFCVLLSVEIGLSPQALFFNVLFSVEFDLFSFQPTLFVCALLFLCRHVHVCGWLGDGCGWACVTWHVSFMQFVVSYY